MGKLECEENTIMVVCCKCNRSSRCKGCVCVKAGKPCQNCLPSRLDLCSNINSASHIVSSPKSSTISSTSTSSVSPVSLSTNVCPVSSSLLGCGQDRGPASASASASDSDVACKTISNSGADANANSNSNSHENENANSNSNLNPNANANHLDNNNKSEVEATSQVAQLKLPDFIPMSDPQVGYAKF